MDANWQSILEVFERALDLEPRERAAFVREASGADEGMRRSLQAMLDAYDRPSSLAGAAPIAPTEIFPPASGEVADGRLRPGTVVDGKYRVEGLVGSGGMGAVYRATHLALQRPVALKGIRADLLENPTAAERFRREAVAVARLRHPNIVTLHDYGAAPGVGAYLVMELLEGRSLRDELAGGLRLDPAFALEVMAQVCAAVGAAHRAGVVHRDLKPENVFLERRDGALAVKVVDFGLAKLQTPARSLDYTITDEGAVLGTPYYMSPEQCRGEEADARSDVYALGCVLFEMLTGERPFAGKTTWAVVYRHVSDAPRRPSEVAPGLAPALDEAVLRALAKDPADRFQTAEALAEALAGVRAEAPAAPAPSGPHPPPRPPTNLPHAVTLFVGRERQLAEVRGWLARTRLVTLVGPGGIGKTRLALEAAARAAEEFADGAWLVELAPIADPALVPRAVGAALGVREHGGSDAEAVAGWLRDKRLLLVLDNCEHLVAACAGLTERLLEASPGLRVLATSRESLGVAGEAAWQVPALAVPPPGDGRALESEAARLFADRASLANPGFHVSEETAPVVAELCRRLEGIPLAIELAAARAKALSVGQILERLDDRFRLLAVAGRGATARQQALEATLDWSHELLTDEERALFRRLSVFSGGWTLEAAEAVARCELGVSSSEGVASGEPGLPPRTSQLAPRTSRLATPDALDLLARLVDKSLVTVQERAGAVRYAMLEMIRDYAAGRLERAGEADAARRRHAQYFLERAESVMRPVWGVDSAEWLQRVEEDHDNVRAALAWLLEHDPEACLRLATAVNSFRELRGHLAEARRTLEAALERSPGAPAALRATALLSAGTVAASQGDVAAARAFHERAVPVAKEAGDPRQIARVTYGLGALAHLDGDLDTARTYLREAVAIGRENGLPTLVASALNSLGEVARREGDLDAAKGLYEEAVAICRRENHAHALMVTLCNLGAVSCDGGELGAARARYAEALETARTLGSQEFVSLALDGMAAVAARRGEPVRAARLFGAAAGLLAAVGAARSPVDRAFAERHLDAARAALGGEALEAALAAGRRMTAEEAVDEALADRG